MGNYIACNESTNFYISCSTDISTNMGTTGALFPTLSNLNDSTFELSCIAKFNSSGFRQWGTYYPAMSGPIVLDHQGDLLFVSGDAGWGTTCVTPGAYQTVQAGGGDICICKFTPNGTRLWATYYGGSGQECCADITVDNNDNIIVSGNTASTNNIATSGTFQPTYNALTDDFIVKFNSSGQRLWGTYYGSPWDENHQTCVAVDALGNIYLTGKGQYPTYFATPGAFQMTPSGGFEDCYFAKFSSTGQRIWGTYFGGPDEQFIYAMKVDNHDNIIFSGETTSSVGIGSSNGHHPTYAGNGDGFVEKFSSSGARIWGSYYGGAGQDNTVGFDLDNNGNIVITGATTSDTGVATPGTYDDTLINGEDGYLAFLDSNGTFTQVGINDLNQNTASLIKVYPNPATNKITVSINDYAGKSGSINLQSIDGKLLKQLSVKTEATNVDMSGLPSGTYLLQYDDGEVCETVKVVKE